MKSTRNAQAIEDNATEKLGTLKQLIAEMLNP
jgi:hypothetical protein